MSLLIDRKELRLAVSAFLALTSVVCTDAKPVVNPNLPQTPASSSFTPETLPRPGVTPTETPVVSEKRKSGILLEQLDLSNFTGEEIRGSFQEGKIKLENFTRRYSFIINRTELQNAMRDCNVTNIQGEYQLYMVEGNPLPPPSISLPGRSIFSVQHMDGAFEYANLLLNNSFEIAAIDKKEALDRLATLGFNSYLIEELCYLGYMNSYPEGKFPSNNEENQATLDTRQKGDSFSNGILRGQNKPIIVIKHQEIDPHVTIS